MPNTPDALPPQQPPTPPPQQGRKRKRAHPLPPTLGCLLRRLGELSRLAAFRAHHDVRLGKRGAWAMLLAEICLYQFGQDGCDLLNFRRIEPENIVIDDDVALAAIHKVCDLAERKGIAYRHIGTATAGKMLGVTSEECWACDIRTMRAIDATPADAETAKGELREHDRMRKLDLRRSASAADREREAERGRKRRAAKGAKPREQYLAEAAAKAEQWQAKGVSRRTWYRHRGTGPSASGRGTSPSVHHSLIDRERTDALVPNRRPAPLPPRAVPAEAKGVADKARAPSEQRTTPERCLPRQASNVGAPDGRGHQLGHETNAPVPALKRFPARFARRRSSAGGGTDRAALAGRRTERRRSLAGRRHERGHAAYT